MKHKPHMKFPATYMCGMTSKGVFVFRQTHKTTNVQNVHLL